MNARWLEEARGIDLYQVAAELGIERQGRGHLSPCPECGETGRSRTDRRSGPVFTTRRGTRWRCQRCDAQGDGLDLVRSRLGLDWSGVRAWYAGRGWCEPAADTPVLEWVTPRPPPPRPPSQHPPLEAIRELWVQCGLVGDDPEVVDWLRSRGLDPAVVEDRGLARALPSGGLPGWARHWPERGARCVFALVDGSGEVVTLRARRVSGDGPKVWALRDAPPAVLADGTARAVLRGETWPEEAGVRCLFVTEGEVDWLARNALLSEDQSSPAVLGIPGAGAWPEWLSGRIPDGWAVKVDAHLDDAGQRLLARVVDEVADRCPITRSAPRRAP